MFWQKLEDKYALSVTYNLGLGRIYGPCSAGHFLSMHPSSVDRGIQMVQWLTKFSLWMPHSLWVQNRNVHFAQFVGTVVPCNHFLTHSAKLSPKADHNGVT